jgi:molybdopterin molybdotransferase
MRGFAERTPVGEALGRLLGRLGALAPETIPVVRAVGRVAAADVTAPMAVPHFVRAMMDGYAVTASATAGATPAAPRPLALVGEIRAGPAKRCERPLAAGEAVRITTGAPLPVGADAVLMAELGEPAGEGRIHALGAVSPGRHVAAIGEDIAAGSVVLRAGRRLRPQDAGVLCSVGVGGIAVVRQPRVRIVVTGDELLAPGEAPRGACIVDSNSVLLAALTDRDGGLVEAVCYVGDGAARTREALAAPGVDVVLVSGGSSVGPEDHGPAILAEVGELAVHGVCMRPASPAGFGFVAGADRRPRPVVLLPGNPVSCLCAYEFFAGPAIRVLGGRSPDWPHRRTARLLAAKLVSELGRTDYARVRFDTEGRAVPLSTSGASILSSTTVADGVVIVPAEREGFAAGETVEVLLYDP